MEESSCFPGAPDTISRACHWFWNSLKVGLWTLGLSDDVVFASVACLHILSRFAPFVCPSPSPGTGKPHTAPNKHLTSRISLTQANVVATKNEFSPSILDGSPSLWGGFQSAFRPRVVSLSTKETLINHHQPTNIVIFRVDQTLSLRSAAHICTKDRSVVVSGQHHPADGLTLCPWLMILPRESLPQITWQWKIKSCRHDKMF
jgi:hypothetical protein